MNGSVIGRVLGAAGGLELGSHSYNQSYLQWIIQPLTKICNLEYKVTIDATVVLSLSHDIDRLCSPGSYP
ncbi:hypothetical protein C5167_027198 [Papaver somniferum]|nr:hypothetical protein C5167_027198 [Papaver somniferum]